MIRVPHLFVGGALSSKIRVRSRPFAANMLVGLLLLLGLLLLFLL
jgi:hypothetical protein